MFKTRLKAYLFYVPLAVFLAYTSYAFAASFQVGVDMSNAKPFVLVDEDGNSVNDSNPLSVVSEAVEEEPEPQPTPDTDRLEVASAGTAEPFALTNDARELCIFQAFEENTGMVAIGNSTVDAAEATRNGIVLAPLSSVTLYDIDLVNMWIDAEVTGEGVTIYCEYAS